MIRSNPLAEICRHYRNQISEYDEEIISLIVKVSGCLWATGSSSDDIHQILPLLVRSFEHGGRRSVSGLIKGWSNAIRSLLARNRLDTTTVGHCKQPRNCRFSLRSLGATPAEIDYIIATYDGICGIPPLLLLSRYWRVLLRNPSLELFQAVGPLSNLGRCSPLADQPKLDESERSFYEMTGKIPLFQFDLTHIGHQYGKLCRGTPPSSRIEINSHASFGSTRETNGKWGEFCRGVVDTYLYQTISDLVPVRPNSDLFDVLGNLVLRRDDWSEGVPITDVMYPDLMSSNLLDRRLGLFTLDWAIRTLHREFPGDVLSDAPFLTFGSFIPNLCFDGKLPSRVISLAEEGFKGRVITVVMLCVSIIQSVARFFLDPPMRTDKSVKIGLLSKVKLYDFLVHLNQGGRRGVEDFSSLSVFLRTALSADLTTSTDTPYANGPLSLLRGFMRTTSNLRTLRFLEFAIEVGCSPRGFESRLCPPGHVHRCGIMMGEGLSGTYLNVMSGIVRALLYDFMDYFDFYGGETVDDAETFVSHHHCMIQTYLHEVDIDSFGDASTQSGDDVIFMTSHLPSEVRRFLILLYTILGERPSESTFYSSEFYATFTEEMAIRHSETLGWVFIDCIKPRLYSCSSPDGISPIISHISQITGSLKYVRDESYINRVCDVVDSIIGSNTVIRERVDRYNLVPSFPPDFGGLNHPVRLLPGMEVDVPLEDRSMIMRLLGCSLEELWQVKYSWATEDLPDDENAREIRESLRYLFQEFSRLPQGDEESGVIDELHRYSEDTLCDRKSFPSYNTYREELEYTKRELGLSNLDELAETVANGMRFLQQVDAIDAADMNPLIRLRNRREFLMSKTRDLPGDGHKFVWSDLDTLRWRIQSSFKGQFVVRDSFLDLLDFLDLPSLSVPVMPVDMGGRTDDEPPA